MGQSQQVLEWQQEARIELKREFILQVLRKRFQAAVPPKVVGRVEALTHQDELDRWLDTAWTAASLEEFLTAVQA
jgi:hypothetical protein